MKTTYDTVQGIESYLVDLDGLNKLIQDRREAYYDRKEQLDSFIIMGRWSTDTCGNFGPVLLEDHDGKKITIADDFPLVLPHCALKMRPFGIYRVTTYHEPSVPLPHVICKECGKGWTLNNAHDTFVSTEDKYILPITLSRDGIERGMEGKTLAEVEAMYGHRSDGVYFTSRERQIRNAKLVDMTPDPEYEGRVVNRVGSKTVTKDYVLEFGDEVNFVIRSFQHKKCHDFGKAVEERKSFDKIFSAAGFHKYVMSEIPNGYCPCEICAPWQSVKTLYGVIKIGWRKRVINIDWSATERNLEHLFIDEKVTKGETFIHAWGDDKAVEYLTKIRTALNETITESKKDRPEY